MVSPQEAIHVVIPTWRGRTHVESLLASLATQTLKPAAVWVVDGGSGDGTAELARGAGAAFLDLKSNRGFAAAVNAGIAACNGQRIAVLNNDLRLASNWLEVMAGTPGPFVTGKVLAWDGPPRIDATWDLVSESGVPMRAGFGRPDGAFFNQPREICLAPWTAITIERDYWRATGGLDESFESYLEDVDIGLRGMRLGYRGRYEPAALCWHRGSSTLGAWHPRQVRLTSRNQLRLIARHGQPDWFKVLVGQGLWGLAAARHGCFFDWLAGKREALRDLRIASAKDNCLAQLEQEAFAVSAETGFDRFWQWYWALCL